MSEEPKPSERPERNCPVCDQVVKEGMPTFPFCSKRCRTIDLGKWLDGSYRITRPIEQRDLDESE